MKAVAMLGLSPGLLSGSADANSVNTVLGEFEDGMDGWRTNGGVSLSRVSKEERPYAVENGDYALSVEPNGDAFPVIENRSNVDGVNFVETPYLVGRIRSLPGGNEETLTLVLRYHHQATPAERSGQSGNGQGNGGKPALVEETTLSVVNGGRSTFSWDLTDLDDDKLRSPQRLEIGWYLGDSPPDTGPRGNQAGGPVPGRVFLDAIRMTGSRELLERSSFMNYMDNLVVEHRDYRYESRSFYDDSEEGAFVFADGTELDVRWEDLGSDGERFTIDGRTFRLGGDTDE